MIMNQFKRCSVVLLPTNQKAKLMLVNNKLEHHSECIGKFNQHLYFIDDSPINQNDWIFYILEKN